MSSKNWDWNAEDSQEDIIIKRVCAVAVYQNPSEDIVIRQEDPLGDEDQVLVIPKEYARALIKAISDILG